MRNCVTFTEHWWVGKEYTRRNTQGSELEAEAEASGTMGRLSASIGDLRCAEEAVYCSRGGERSSWSALSGSASGGVPAGMMGLERRLTEDEQWTLAAQWVLRQDRETLKGTRRMFRRFRNLRWWPACLR